MKKIEAIVCLILLACGIMFAQNTKNFTPLNMYTRNTLLVNPAYSGARESMSATLMHGVNWPESFGAIFGDGFKAGRTFSGTFDFPFKERNAVAGSFIYNSYGVNTHLAFYGHYSFRIVTGLGKLHFGLRAGYNHYSRNLRDAVFRDQGDPMQFVEQRRGFPNFGAGVYWYSTNYYAGLSVPDFFFPPKGSESFDGDPANYNYTLIGGYLFRFSDDFKLKPSAMFMYSLKAPLAYHINLSLITFQDRIWLSTGYKSKGIVIMGEYQHSSQWRFGAAWEFPTGGVRTFVNGSFELLIRYDFSYELRAVSPAYFY